jgi:hypothetical protein
MRPYRSNGADNFVLVFAVRQQSSLLDALKEASSAGMTGQPSEMSAEERLYRVRKVWR